MWKLLFFTVYWSFWVISECFQLKFLHNAPFKELYLDNAERNLFACVLAESRAEAGEANEVIVNMYCDGRTLGKNTHSEQQKACSCAHADTEGRCGTGDGLSLKLGHFVPCPLGDTPTNSPTFVQAVEVM